jgi:hypothetical protein
MFTTVLVPSNLKCAAHESQGTLEIDIEWTEQPGFSLGHVLPRDFLLYKLLHDVLPKQDDIRNLVHDELRELEFTILEEDDRNLRDYYASFESSSSIRLVKHPFGSSVPNDLRIKCTITLECDFHKSFKSIAVKFISDPFVYRHPMTQLPFNYLQLNQLHFVTSTETRHP